MSVNDSAQGPQGPQLTRRNLLKAGAAAGTAAVVGSSGQFSQPGRAIVPAIAVGAAAVGTNWALREHGVLVADDPPDGLTEDALHNEVFNTVQTRSSTNRSTFIDNMNILDGAGHVAYADGKIAAIESLNNQDSQSEVQTAATDAVDEYEATLLENVFKSWDESVNELLSLQTALQDHSELLVQDVFQAVGTSHQIDTFSTKETTYNFGDGTSYTLQTLVMDFTDREPDEWSPLESQGDTVETFRIEPVDLDGNTGQRYLQFGEWNDLYQEITTLANNTRDGLITWVDTVYSDVQAGDLNVDDLVTPRELAELTADEEEQVHAVADLLALNMPVDTEREAEIYLPGSDVTLYGILGMSEEHTLIVGDQIDPDQDDRTYWFTYDVSQGHGVWDDVEEGIDGGEVTFTAEPHEDTLFHISTGAHETAEVHTDDFSDEGDGTWTVSISDQVETEITTVSEVDFYSDVDETQNETIILNDEFHVEGFVDSDGQDHDSAVYSRAAEPESDNNYITAEEWQEREEQYQELIEAYEESTGGGGGGLPGFGDFSPMQTVYGAVVLGGIALVISWFSG